MSTRQESWIEGTRSLRVSGALKDETLGAVAYVGTTFHADMTLAIDNDALIETARIILRFRALGSGSPETHDLIRRTFATNLEGPIKLEPQRFELDVPENAPISYEGVYVKIQWSIAISLTGPEGLFDETEYRVWVKPRPVGFETSAKPKHDFANLQPIQSDFVLSSRETRRSAIFTEPARRVVEPPRQRRSVAMMESVKKK